MSLSASDVSVGVFVRGLTNVKSQLRTAEAHAAASGWDAASLLDARLSQGGRTSDVPYDLHTYNFAAHVHWAAEGARLAIARIVGAPAVPAPNPPASFLGLHQRIDATIGTLQATAAGDIEAGLGRGLVVEHRRGAVSADGGRFLLAYAIPHFFYHVTTAYDILRREGVPLTMGDFLGPWGSA
jgi:hypothetical protein